MSSPENTFGQPSSQPAFSQVDRALTPPGSNGSLSKEQLAKAVLWRIAGDLHTYIGYGGTRERFEEVLGKIVFPDDK